MTSFTCISCRVAFGDADLQRAHYKTDWHRYNLKRKVAELPPVTAEVFQQKVLAQRAQAAEEQSAKELKGQYYCNVCKKHFNNQSTLNNHLNSRKHLEEVERFNANTSSKETEDSKYKKLVEEENAKNRLLSPELASSSDTAFQQSVTSTSVSQREDVDMQQDESDAEDWEGDALGIEQCLFCSNVSNSLESNVEHMTSMHSFFIPDFEYLADLEGLITYLGGKVGEGHMCLWCNDKGRSFYSTRAVQQHMIDMGHCKMVHDGDAIVEYADFYDYRKSYPDYKSEENGPARDGSDEIDESVLPNLLDSDGFELTLPSGATVGHRQLARYYKQNLVPVRRASATAMSRIMSQYRSLGWTCTAGCSAHQKAKDIAYLQKCRQKYFMKLGVKSNKLQRHFRDQVFI